MKTFVRMLLVLVGAALLGAGSNARTVEAATVSASAPVFGPHDGIVTVSKQHAFETVFAPGGISVFMFDAQMAPMLMQRVKATAIVTIKGFPAQEVGLKLDGPREGEKQLYFCPMHPSVAQPKPGTCEACGGMELIPQDCIRGVLDLSKATPGDVSAAVSIKGMKGNESDAAFTIVWATPPKK